MRPSPSVFFVVACALSGCAETLPAPATAVTPATPAAAPRPVAFTVVPAELADRDVVTQIRHRARMRRFTSIWLSPALAPIKSIRNDRDDRDVVVAVLDETSSRIRIVAEGDDARLAVWVPRDDTWRTLVAPVQLADREGRTSALAGVWVTTRGAPIELTPATRAGARREVRVHDRDMVITGHVPAALIANVWVAEPGDPAPSLDPTERRAWTAPADSRERVSVWISTKVHSGLGPKAPVIAVVENSVIATVVNRVGDYRELEIVRPHARIRGYVAAAELSPTGELAATGGSGGGFGFGMSHADRIDVPAGTCLYDSVAGDVVGVQLLPTTRLGRRNTDRDGWSLVYVGTMWSTASVYVRDTSDDPKQPRWESCMESAHR